MLRVGWVWSAVLVCVSSCMLCFGWVRFAELVCVLSCVLCLCCVWAAAPVCVLSCVLSLRCAWSAELVCVLSCLLCLGWVWSAAPVLGLLSCCLVASHSSGQVAALVCVQTYYGILAVLGASPYFLRASILVTRANRLRKCHILFCSSSE